MIVDTNKKNIKLGSLAEIAEGLRELTFLAKAESDHVVVKLEGDNGRAYPVVLRVRNDGMRDDLLIACQIGTIHDLTQEDLANAFYAMACSNMEILPYAFSVVDEPDTDNDPIVLVNSIPLGDFSLSELQAAMDTLRRALHVGIDLLPWKK